MRVNNVSVYRLQQAKFNQSFGCGDCENKTKNNTVKNVNIALAGLFAAAAVSVLAASEKLPVKALPDGTGVNIEELNYVAASEFEKDTTPKKEEEVKKYPPMDVYRRKRDENVMPEMYEDELGTATLDIEG